MAIAFVAATSGTNGGVGTTLGLTLNVGAGSDRGLIAAVWANTNVAISADFNGDAMSEIASIKYSSTNETLHIYALSNPDSGSHTLTFTGSGGIEMFGEGSAYTGCHQTSTSLLTNTASAETAATSPITQSTTPTNANCWGIAACGGQRNASASTGVTTRAGNATQGTIGDSNGTITQASPYSMSFTIASPLRQLILVGSINEPGAAGPTNLKSLDGNLKANIKSYNGNLIANVKSISGNS